MQNYTEWLNNKMYEGHVRRLTEIKQKKQLKTVRTSKNLRIKTQPTKSQPNIKREFLPLPLVSKDERVLLGSVVKQRTMTLRQKQSLLENYLLSKRILETNSVFDSKLLKKQFNFHKKVSENMNRSIQKNRQAFSSLRKQKFSELQKLREDNYLGTGTICFKINLKEIMLIKRKLQQNSQSRFNLIYKPDKFKSYHVKVLTFSELISNWHRLRATKKQAQRKNGLKVQIEEVRSNDIHKLAQFRVHLKSIQISKCQQQSGINPENNQKQKSNKDFTQEQQTIQNFVQKLLHPVTKFLIGTIQFTIKLKNYTLNSQDK